MKFNILFLKWKIVAIYPFDINCYFAFVGNKILLFTYFYFWEINLLCIMIYIYIYVFEERKKTCICMGI